MLKEIKYNISTRRKTFLKIAQSKIDSFKGQFHGIFKTSNDMMITE